MLKKKNRIRFLSPQIEFFFFEAAHLFWCIWALVQSQISLIDYEYVGLAILRHQMFRRTMNDIASQRN